MDVKESGNDSSYDEVFFGRLTLREVKKRIFMDVHQKNKFKLAGRNEKDLNSNDFKIIKTSSQPNLLSHSHTDGAAVERLKSTSDPLFDNKHIQVKSIPSPECKGQDSFLELEKNVTEQCKSLINCDNNNLDNTLDFVDFILNHAQLHGKENTISINKQEGAANDKNYFNNNKTGKDEILPQSNYNEEKSQNVHENIEKNTLNTEPAYTPNMNIKFKQNETPSKSSCVKSEVVGVLSTAIGIKKENSNLFKTPKFLPSGRKDTSPKKTPSRLKTYEHVASPIAMYIRNCPQVPLVKDVHPKKPLPSSSLIPKLLKSAPESKSDKENVMLPQLAYRSAKKTLVIDVNKEKLPQSHWAQKLTSTSRKPVVLKHNHREAGRKPLLMQQESFQDLSLHQADVSICTQKLAFTKL